MASVIVNPSFSCILHVSIWFSVVLLIAFKIPCLSINHSLCICFSLFVSRIGVSAVLPGYQIFVIPRSPQAHFCYLFSVQLTLSNLLFPHISNECILVLSFFFIAHHSDAYAAMGNTSDLNNLIFALLLINFPSIVVC